MPGSAGTGVPERRCEPNPPREEQIKILGGSGALAELNAVAAERVRIP